MALTRIRNPFVFAASLVLLATAAWLGQEAPTDGLDAFDSDVRLQGDLFDAVVPESSAWAPVRSVLSNVTLWMQAPDVADVVLVTGLDAADVGEDRVVHGAVVYAGAHPDDASLRLVVVAADSVLGVA